jgi:transposase
MKTKLTPELQALVVEALNSGNYIETAAAYAGIHEATVYRWLERGRIERARLSDDDGAEEDPEETPYREFCEAVEKTRANAEVRSLALIQKAAMDGTWQASAWYLERSYPRKWGRFERQEITGANGAPLSVVVSVDELESKLNQVIAMRATDKSKIIDAPEIKATTKKKSAPKKKPVVKLNKKPSEEVSG